MTRIFLIISILLLLIGCKKSAVEGIHIGETLLVHRSYSEYQQLKLIIKGCLNKEESAFQKLNIYDCGGGAGCYDLGYILSQIVYRIGEEHYITTVRLLSNTEQKQLSWLIEAGLEYGDNNYDGEQDNKNLKSEFPKIYKLTE